MLRKRSVNRIISLQVIKPHETWPNEFYCLFFLSWLPTSFPFFLLYILLSVLPALFLSYCTLLYAFIPNLSCAFPSSLSPNLMNLFISFLLQDTSQLHFSHSISLNYLSHSTASHPFPRYIHITTCVHTLREKHMSLSNCLQYVVLISTFWHKFRNIAPLSSPLKGFGILMSPLPSLFCIWQATSFATTYRKKRQLAMLYSGFKLH